MADNLKKAEKTLYGLHGIEVLHNAEANKSTAFTEEEREALGLTGLLPSGVETLEEQVLRVLQQLETKKTDLGRCIFIIGLRNDRHRCIFTD